MNIPEPREQGLRPSGDTAPSSALMSALTTEHYTLQAARSSAIIEANGRSSLFLSAVSGALLALRWSPSWTGSATPSWCSRSPSCQRC